MKESSKYTYMVVIKSSIFFVLKFIFYSRSGYKKLAMLSVTATVLLFLVRRSESPVHCAVGTFSRQSGYYWMSIIKTDKCLFCLNLI